MNMLPILIAGLAALAVVIIAAGIAMSGGGGTVASRLERYAPGDDAGADDAEKGSAVVAGLTRVIDRQDMATRIATDLARADLKMRPAEWLLAWAASPFVFVALAYVAGFIFPGFQNIVALASRSWWACSSRAST